MENNIKELINSKIVVLYGGESLERDISIKSGKAVYKALKNKGCNVSLIDLKDDIYEKLDGLSADIVFVALHGSFGEDGRLQRELEIRKLFFTGSDSNSSALAMNKLLSKELFLKNNIRVPDYVNINDIDDYDKISESLELPVVIKPVSEGSSIGLYRVKSEKEIKDALIRVFSCSKQAMAEQFIEGREFTVGILTDEPLPVLEIFTSGDFYDYNAKYNDLNTCYKVPADITGDIAGKIKKTACDAYRALGCRDFARVDLRMNSQGEVFVLEVNTVPGLTERSLLPKAANAAGINFDDLCLTIIGPAFSRRGG